MTMANGEVRLSQTPYKCTVLMCVQTHGILHSFIYILYTYMGNKI